LKYCLREEKYMKKQIVISGIAILFIVVGLSGCFDSDNSNSELNKFVGTWKLEGLEQNTYTFFSDGTGSGMGDSIEWEIGDGKLEVYWLDRAINLTFDYEFLNNDETLLLTEEFSGHIEGYIKQ